MAQKAPGKHFRTGLSLLDVTMMFPTDEAAEQWFVEFRWPDGPACPCCGSTNVQAGCKHKTMPYRCRERKACGKRFSVRTDTVMESSKLGYQVWAIAMYLVATNLKGISSMKLHRDLNITQKSAWHLTHRLRKSFESGNVMLCRAGRDRRNLHGREREEQAQHQEVEGRSRHHWQGGGHWREGPGDEQRQGTSHRVNEQSQLARLCAESCGERRPGLYGRSCVL